MLHDDTIFGSRYTWSVTLHTSLRLNISFHYIRIYYMNLYKCSIGKVVIRTFRVNVYIPPWQHSDDDDIKYCGIWSNTSNYPQHRKTEIIVFSKYRVQYNISMSYSVIDANTVFSCFPRVESSTTKHLMNLLFENNNLTILEYHIVGPKHMRIILFITSRNNSEHEVYDGPGKLSRLLSSNINDKINRIFILSGFQCLVITRVRYHTSTRIYLTNINLSYRQHKIFHKVNVSINSTKTIFMTDHCSFFTWSINNSNEYNMNITVSQLKYIGVYNRQCNVAGFGVFEVQNSIYSDIATICHNAEDYKYQSIYSNGNYLHLVHYAYPEYGTLSVNFTMSTTHCKVIPINTCIFEHNCSSINSMHCRNIMDHPDINASCISGGENSDAMKCHQDPNSQVTLKVSNNECKIIQLNHAVDQYPELLWRKSCDVGLHKTGRFCLWFLNNLKLCRMNNLKLATIPEEGRILKYQIQGLLSGNFASFPHCVHNCYLWESDFFPKSEFIEFSQSKKPMAHEF